MYGYGQNLGVFAHAKQFYQTAAEKLKGAENGLETLAELRNQAQEESRYYGSQAEPLFNGVCSMLAAEGQQETVIKAGKGKSERGS